MRSFSLRTVKLRPGEEYRDEIELELEPFVLGRERYLPVPEKVPAEFVVSKASTGTVFELRFTALTGAESVAAEPARIVLNFHVDDIRAVEARLVALGAVWVRELETTSWGIIGTVLDLDGNYVQIVEPTPDSPSCLQSKEDHG